jgi:hypothetical protein
MVSCSAVSRLSWVFRMIWYVRVGESLTKSMKSCAVATAVDTSPAAILLGILVV